MVEKGPKGKTEPNGFSLWFCSVRTSTQIVNFRQIWLGPVSAYIWCLLKGSLEKLLVAACILFHLFSSSFCQLV